MAFRITILPWWGHGLPTILDYPYKYVIVPRQGSLSLYTGHEDPSIAKLDSYFSWYGLWMNFKGPYVHGHNFWSMCKVAIKWSGFSLNKSHSHTALLVPFFACGTNTINTHYFAKSRVGSLLSDT